MKGKLAQMFPDPEGEYSDVQVCESGAGFYIGTMFTTTLGPFKGMIEPGSQESMEYWATHEEAQAILDAQSWTQREHP